MEAKWTAIAGIVAFVIGIIIAPMMISYLRKLKFGQQIITEYGPTWHKKKQGIPTMGGIIFIFSIYAAYFAVAFPYYASSDYLIGRILPSVGLTSLIIATLLGFMGFIDDFVKIKQKHNQGLTEKQKLIIQIFIGTIFIIYNGIRINFRTSVDIPFTDITIEFSYFFYLFALIAFVGFVNAVNLTDGIDGLATSVTLPVAAFFTVTAIAKNAFDLSILAAALLGGCIAFLVYNKNPAKVFMGDTGSMFLGGTVVTLAFGLDMPLMLVIVGFVYMIEAFSVMIQVVYFKATKGKRLFKMTPIHHHFELSGWSENKICVVFGSVSFVFCLLASLWVLL